MQALLSTGLHVLGHHGWTCYGVSHDDHEAVQQSSLLLQCGVPAFRAAFCCEVSGLSLSNATKS